VGRPDAPSEARGARGASGASGGLVSKDRGESGSSRSGSADAGRSSPSSGRATPAAPGRSVGERTSGRDADPRGGLVAGGPRRGTGALPESSGARNLGRPSPTRRGSVGGIEHTDPIRDLAGRDPELARKVGVASRAVGHHTRAAIETGVSASLACVGLGYGIGAGFWDDNVWIGFWGGWGTSCYSNYWYWWGFGNYPYSYFCHPFSYPYYCYYGYWPSVRYWYPRCYYPVYYSYPAYTASVITHYVVDDYDDYDEDYDTTNVYVDTDGDGDYRGEEAVPVEEYAEPQRGEGVAVAPPPASSAVEPGPDSAARATTQYLTLGDQAFRENRFADAVHFYARAVQFAPQDGVVWLVLSDGLFATGDYHYGAFALRKALELDPTLARSPIDKHGFYADGAEFDRQLAVLEGFVADHPDSGDALLLLAANYVYGGRPAAAVDLLNEPRCESLRREPAGAALLAAAEAVQYGQ
jgi:tetratricopeptide (TPR) repeat protein